MMHINRESRRCSDCGRWISRPNLGRHKIACVAGDLRVRIDKLSSCRHERWEKIGVVGHRWCLDCGSTCQVAWSLEPSPEDWRVPPGVAALSRRGG